MASKDSRTLADGLLTNFTTVLYTVPDGMKTTIRWISAYNDSGSTTSCTFRVRRMGTTHPIGRMTLDASGGHGRFIDRDEELVLAEGDAIQGGANLTNNIEYIISGTEEPVDGQEG